MPQKDRSTQPHRNKNRRTKKKIKKQLTKQGRCAHCGSRKAIGKSGVCRACASGDDA